jgi:hypothetical protein
MHNYLCITYLHLTCYLATTSLLGVSQWYVEGRKLYGKAGFIEASKSFSPEDISPMDGKVVAVTGLIHMLK